MKIIAILCIVLLVAVPAYGDQRRNIPRQQQIRPVIPRPVMQRPIVQRQVVQRPVIQRRAVQRPFVQQRVARPVQAYPNQWRYRRHHHNRNYYYVPYAVPVYTNPYYYYNNYPYYYNYPAQSTIIYRSAPEESIYFNKTEDTNNYISGGNYNSSVITNTNVDYTTSGNDPVPGSHDWQQVSNNIMPMGAVIYQNNNGVISYYCRASYRGTLVYGYTNPGNTGCLVNDTANAVTLLFQNYQVAIRIQVISY